jgi:hypothetical protein
MGKIKRVATSEDEAIVEIPDIVGVVVVAVEPQVRVIPLHVEQLEVAIRVGNI